jgi:(R,R)-butanediol dehydrogenase/meso-butanediol dehydrogenase/diacetyl reductase
VGLASPGGFAEAVTVPLEGLVALPESVSDRVAAFAEPMAVGLHAVARGEVRPGDNVLVFGGGAVGIAVLLAARLAGAAQLFLSEPLAARRELGLRFGATETYDPSRADVPREAYLRTGRIGPDVVFEASGHPQVVLDAISSVRRGGRVVLAGIGQRPVPIDLTRLTLFERSVVGTLGYNFDLPRVVSLLASGRLDEVVGLTLVDRPLSAGAEVFAELRADPARHLKVLLAPRMG